MEQLDVVMSETDSKCQRGAMSMAGRARYFLYIQHLETSFDLDPGNIKEEGACFNISSVLPLYLQLGLTIILTHSQCINMKSEVACLYFELINFNSTPLIKVLLFLHFTKIVTPLWGVPWYLF